VSKFKPFARMSLSVKNPRTGAVWKSAGKIRAFLDSGASISIVPQSLADEIKAKTGEFEIAPAKVETANGQKEATAMKHAKVCLEEVCYRGNVLISGGFMGDMLVGNDFLSRAKCKMDFKARMLNCLGKKIPFTMER
jgi:predicted aspartyl protease